MAKAKIKKEYALNQVNRLLQSGPVVLLTTRKKDRANIMTISWHMMIDSDPPKLALIVNSDSLSHNFLKSTKECVINIPTLKLASETVSCGRSTGKKIDKFKAFGLTPLPASIVKAPLISECFANIECKVIDMTKVTKYDLFILEAVKAWVTPSKKEIKTLHHMGGDKFMVAGEITHVLK